MSDYHKQKQRNRAARLQAFDRSFSDNPTDKENFQAAHTDLRSEGLSDEDILEEVYQDIKRKTKSE